MRLINKDLYIYKDCDESKEEDLLIVLTPGVFIKTEPKPIEVTAFDNKAKYYHIELHLSGYVGNVGMKDIKEQDGCSITNGVFTMYFETADIHSLCLKNL